MSASWTNNSFELVVCSESVEPVLKCKRLDGIKLFVDPQIVHLRLSAESPYKNTHSKLFKFNSNGNGISNTACSHVAFSVPPHSVTCAFVLCARQTHGGCGSLMSRPHIPAHSVTDSLVWLMYWKELVRKKDSFMNRISLLSTLAIAASWRVWYVTFKLDKSHKSSNTHQVTNSDDGERLLQS